MRFKFKKQQYQADAAKAVCDVFEGQPNANPLAFLRDLGTTSRGDGQAQIQIGSDTGYGNAPIQLTSDRLLANARRVQRANQITEPSALSTDIGDICLDVEMETGTGKTYVYIKTMFELNRLYG